MTDPGKSAVVVVTPAVVWQTTTGNVAVTIGPDVVVGVADVAVVDVDVDVDPDEPDAFVVEVVECFGWVVEPVPLFELGPDDPHAASTRDKPTQPTTPATLLTPLSPPPP